MNSVTTGSNITSITSSPVEDDRLVGSLSFFESGIVNIFTSKDTEVDLEVFQTFQMTSDFVIYALTRTDWMQEFLEKYIEESDINDHRKRRIDFTNLPYFVYLYM